VSKSGAEQIAGHEGAALFQHRHETIYRRIRRDAVRGQPVAQPAGDAQFGPQALRAGLTGVLTGKRHISQRPAEVEPRWCWAMWRATR